MMILQTGTYQFDAVGDVHVLLKPNARSVRARWKGGRIHVTAPAGINYAQLHGILREFAPRLEERKPEAMYWLGQRLEMPDFDVSIDSQTRFPDRILMSYKDGHGQIMVGSAWDMESHDTMRAISKMLCSIAQRIAPSLLIPMAREEAARVKREPLGWTISNGHRTLGHCSSKGIIALSYALLFYPMHLRRYVICHELAHLTEMNHSAAFHEICDSYCDGQEAKLEAELKRHPLPIIR